MFIKFQKFQKFQNNYAKILFKTYCQKRAKPFSDKNHEILGVDKFASIKEIKKAYINVSKEYHPDSNLKHKELYNYHFLKIKKAYEEMSFANIEENQTDQNQTDQNQTNQTDQNQTDQNQTDQTDQNQSDAENENVTCAFVAKLLCFIWLGWGVMGISISLFVEPY